MENRFNPTELLERVDHDLAFLAETVAMLETDGRALMAEIKQAIAAGNAPAVGRSGHTLKGMISNFCAPSVHAMALEVEQAGKAGDCAAASAAAARLEPQLEALIEELTAFTKAHS